MRIVCLRGYVNLEYTIKLANSLCDNNNSVLLLLPVDAITGASQVEENINCLAGKVIAHSVFLKHPRWRAANVTAIIKAVKRIEDFNPDVIHTQDPDLLTFFVLAILKLRGKKYPVVSTFHDINLLAGDKGSFSLRVIRRWVRAISRKIFVLGAAAREILLKKDKRCQDKIVVIPAAIDNSAPFLRYRRERVIPENAALFFGWIMRYKGLEYLIEAEPIITKKIPDFKIIIAGWPAGRDNQNYFKKCRAMFAGKKNFIVHTGYVHYDLAAYLFQRAKVLVLPYIEISQSGVLSIAYEFKLPVVATNLKPLVTDHFTGKGAGLAAPARDPQALAEAIITILSDDALRMNLGMNGYKMLHEEIQPGWNTVVNITGRTYQEIAALRGEK